MRLSPDELIFCSTGFSTQCHHCVYVGLIARLAVGYGSSLAKLSIGLERARWQNLLEIVRTASRNKSKSGAESAAEVSRLSGNALSVHRRQPPSAPRSFPATSRRGLALDHGALAHVRVRGRAPVRALRSKDWATILKILCEADVSSCCRSTSQQLSRTAGAGHPLVRQHGWRGMIILSSSD